MVRLCYNLYVKLCPLELRCILAQVDEIDHTLLKYDLKYLLNMDVELPPVHIELEYEFEPFEKSKADYMEIFEETRGK